jgi:diguanylate cyclase (GGDEF)-like protein
MKDGMDRERLLDIDSYLQPTRRIVFGLLGLSLLGMGPWLGWWTILPLLIAVVLYRVADTKMAGAARPELAIFIAWCTSEVVMASSVQLSGGISVPTVCWVALPVVTLSYRFPLRGVIAGVGFAALLILGLAALDLRAVIDYPPVLVAPMALLLGTATFSIALLNADQKVRREAVIDPLTGLLNRHALASRTAELTQQSAIAGQSIGVVLADLDHFKAVNDNFGHTAGDAVLTDFAYLLRKNLRAFDMAYRIGGEEFLVLLPGASLDEADSVAQKLRATVEASMIGGHQITTSIGVSVSAPTEKFDFERVFAVADAALYDAKHAGRNRVCVGLGGAGGETSNDRRHAVG